MVAPESLGVPLLSSNNRVDKWWWYAPVTVTVIACAVMVATSACVLSGTTKFFWNNPFREIPDVVICGLGDNGTHVKMLLEHLGVSFCPLRESSTHDLTYPCKNDGSSMFKWGIQVPFVLLPVLDAVYLSQQKVLAVVRDPRDVCMKHTFCVADTCECPKCLMDLAQTWASVLQAFDQSTNFHIVRIEDLVMPNPVTSNESKKVLNKILAFFKLSAIGEVILKELGEMHKHEVSYDGGHISEQMKKEIVQQVANCPDSIHQLMLDIGYQIQDFGLVKPASRLIISS